MRSCVFIVILAVCLVRAAVVPGRSLRKGKKSGKNALKITRLKSGNDALRIINGKEAVPGQFPWHASIEITYPNNSVAECSGSLIDPSWVLTTANCIKDGSSFEVRLGSLFRTRGGLVFSSNVAYTHEEFNTGANVDNFNHDIGLIKLSSPVQQSDTIKVIRLLPEEITVLNKLQISGWGKMSDDVQSIYPDALMYANASQLYLETCRETFWFITPQSMCTVGSRDDPVQSPCQGDFGGPVVLPGILNVPYLVGVVSFGDSFCSFGAPSGHTRVVPYKTWINNKMML